MQQQNKKTPLVFRVGVILLFVMLFSVHLMSGLYARYATTVEGSDEAKVARFSVTPTLQVTKADGTVINSFVVGDSMSPGEKTRYVYTVTNNSEVVVRFTVSGSKLMGDLPLVMDTKSITLQPNTSAPITFDVVWPEAQNEISLGGMISMIEISVSAEQVD